MNYAIVPMGIDNSGGNEIPSEEERRLQNIAISELMKQALGGRDSVVFGNKDIKLYVRRVDIVSELEEEAKSSEVGTWGYPLFKLTIKYSDITDPRNAVQTPNGNLPQFVINENGKLIGLYNTYYASPSGEGSLLYNAQEYEADAVSMWKLFSNGKPFESVPIYNKFVSIAPAVFPLEKSGQGRLLRELSKIGKEYTEI